MSLHRLFLPPLTSLRSLAFIACSTHVFRASYSSTGSSRRSLQTATVAPSTHGLDTPPPPPRGAGVHSSLTSPANETQRPGPPPAPTAAARPKIRARKAAITLTPPAVQRLQSLLAQPDPKLIRVGVKNRGCSGLAYSLEYVDAPGRFDEEVVQGGVRVLIDSKALFSIIGSEMDWVEDKLSARFVFRNPNISKLSFSSFFSFFLVWFGLVVGFLLTAGIEEQCGCGESFSVG